MLLCEEEGGEDRGEKKPWNDSRGQTERQTLLLVSVETGEGVVMTDRKSVV